jgi:hypothetical protein
MKTSTRLALVSLILAVAASLAAAEQKTLQNENLVTGAAGTIQLGFIVGDIGAAALEAAPGDYPLTLLTVQILIADSSGEPLNLFRDYVITIYDNGNVNPGTPVYTSPPTTLGSNVFSEIDVSGQGITIPSGKFTVGASAVSGTLPAEPNLVTDNAGCQFGKSRIFDTFSQTWYDACTLGVGGQIAIRAVVETGGTGGEPPQVLVVVPDTGPAAGGTEVTVFGNNFASGATVSFGGVESSSVTFVSSNALDAVTPPHDGGLVDVEVCNPDLQCGTLVDGFEYEALACLKGSVNAALGDIRDVLFVNGSTGGGGRIVTANAGELLWASMFPAPGGGNGKFVVHADLGEPTAGTQTALPAGVGTVCFPFLLPAGADPDAVWNNIGKIDQVGASQYFDGSSIPDPLRAPSIFLLLFDGDVVNLPAGTSVTFQGIVVDPQSTSSKGASATNAVILRVM